MNRSSLALVAVAAFALTACSESAETASTYTPQPPAGASQNAGDGPHEPTATATATRTVTKAAAVPKTEPVDPYRVPDGRVYFVSPTGKIACGLNTQLAGCQVQTPVIPAHATCSGGTVPVGEIMKGYYAQDGGPFQASCFSQGDFVMAQNQKVLPYGHSLTANGMTCLSETTGVTCSRGDHGFFVSAQSFRQW